MCFSKSDPRPFGVLKQVFLAHFEPVVTWFGPRKIPKCLAAELERAAMAAEIADI